MAQDRKGRGLNMYPPGKVIFMRPFKVLKRGREGGDSDSYRKKWDAVWVSPREVIGEGILVSKRVSFGGGVAFQTVWCSATRVAARKGVPALEGRKGCAFQFVRYTSKSGVARKQARLR